MLIAALHHSNKKLVAGMIIPVVLLLIIGSIMLFRINAQDAGQAIEISPPSQELEVEPGESYTLTVKIRNKSATQLPIEVRVEDFVATGDEGQVALVEEGPWSVSSWTTISPDSFTLNPGETQEVEAQIDVPSDGAAGGRYGSLVFSVTGEREAGAAAVSQEIGSLFLIRIAGAVDEQMSLVSFSAPKFSEYGPIPFSMKFRNEGNIHSRAYGLINVTNMFGHKIADIVVPPTNVFPGAERIIKAELDKKVLIGPHTAIAVMYYGNNESVSLNATTTFFVFPYKVAIGIVGLLLVLFLIRKRLKKASRALFK